MGTNQIVVSLLQKPNNGEGGRENSSVGDASKGGDAGDASKETGGRGGLDNAKDTNAKDTNAKDTTTRNARLQHYDTIRFISILFIMHCNLYYITNAVPAKSNNLLGNYSYWFTLLFLIAGRVCTSQLVNTSVADNQKDSQSTLLETKNNNGQDMEPAWKIDYNLLTQHFTFKALRLGIPAFLVCLLQWQMMADGFLNDLNTFQISYNSTSNVVAQWAFADGFIGVCVYMLNLFTIDTTGSGFPVGAMLFMITWSFWGALFCYFIIFLTASLSKSRYFMYFALAYFSWATYAYNLVFLGGLVLHDLARPLGFFQKKHQLRSISRIVLVIVALFLAVFSIAFEPCQIWLDGAFQYIQLYNVPIITGSNLVSCICVMVLVESLPVLQLALGFWPLQFLSIVTFYFNY